MSMLKIYKRLLDKHFLLVQCVQTGLLMGTGDVIAQAIVEKKSFKQYEPKRTAQFALLGAGFIGPALTTWYKILAKHVGVTGKTVALKKVALDQLLFAPVFLACIITGINLVQGKSWSHAKQEVKTKHTDIVLANWKIWPAVQVINFYFMPLQYQVLLVQVVSLFWNAYLSWKTQQKD